MHPVIKNLLARQNKTSPYSDGRKISLVLYGGMMIGIRSLGAMEILEELGLGEAFDNIYTVSAGFPVATGLLAGEAHRLDSILFEGVDYSRLINPWRFNKILDTEYMVEIVKTRLPNLAEKVLANPTLLYGRVVNKTSQKLEYKEVHELGQENFYKLFQATIAVPVLRAQPVKIGNDFYCDTNIIPYLHEHINHALAGPDTDILVIYNFHLQRVRKLPKSDRVFEICPPTNWKLSRFEKNPDKLRAARDQMREYVNHFLSEN